MSELSYEDKYFVGVVNYDDGDATKDTLFHYRQKGDVVWGTYEGGNIAPGNSVARVLEDGRLDMIWQSLNKDGQFHWGTCLSTPEVLPDGRIRLSEVWRTLSGDGVSGSSVIEQRNS